MADTQQQGGEQGNAGRMFTEPTTQARSFPIASVIVAAIVVILGAGIYAAIARRHAAPPGAANALQPVAAYGPNIKLTNIQLSESTSYSGGKETYIDGHLINSGPSTVTGLTAQVLFAPEGGGAPQMETVPVTLIRMRQPYVDVEPVSAAPLAPGAAADFRMIFDDVRPEWNQQPPEIHITGVTTQ